MRLTLLHPMCVVCFMVMATQYVSAQKMNSTLFTPTTRSAIGFNADQSQKLDSMIANPIYENYFFVDVADLHDVQDEGNVYVNLPDSPEIDTFYAKNVEYKSDSTFTYLGHFGDCDDRMGYLHLLGRNGDVFGQISIAGEVYDLQDFGGKKNVLFKIDADIYENTVCTQSDTTKARVAEVTNNTISNAGYRGGGGCTVRVLVFYTEQAEQIDNIQNSAQYFISEANQILNNSEVNNFRYELAGIVKCDLKGYMFLGIGDFLDGFRDWVKLTDLREEYEADMMILLMNANFEDIFGLSYLQNWGDPDYAYAVCEVDAGRGRRTFAHELSHDFGCKHDDSVTGPPEYVYEARGKRFNAPVYHRRRTLMCGDVGRLYSRILHLSNPDVYYKRNRTGDVDSRDNAQQMRDMGCFVSDYYYSTPKLDAHISGPRKGDNSGTYTWCVEVNHCNTTPVISWEYSYDGFNYLPFAGNELCITRSLPYDKSLYIRVHVTCGDVTISKFHSVLNTQEDPCKDIVKRLSSSTDMDGQEAISIFPNPAEDILTIAFCNVNPKSSFYTVEILNMKGQLLISKECTDTNGKICEENINIATLLPGQYLVRLKNESINDTRMFHKN